MKNTIPLTKGYEALIDPEMYEDLIQFRWRVLVQPHTCYALRTPSKAEREAGALANEYMHARVLGVARPDHINQNGLDNRLANLRPSTARQNSYNTRPSEGCSSAYKGVTWARGTKNWKAQIRLDGKNTHLGYFEVEDAAARAYDQAAYGRDPEFSYLNFPEEYRA